MAEQTPTPPEPVDVHNGMPDNAARKPAWKYALLAGLFVAWLTVLAGLFLIARP